MSTPNLLELLQNLLRDPTAYREDPEGFLSASGDVSPDDIREALILLQDRQDSDLGRVNNPGGNHVVHVPPPPPAAAPHPGESNQEAAIRYLDTYVTSNHIGAPEPAVDDSAQQTGTDDAEFDQDFDEDIDADSAMTSGDEDEDEDSDAPEDGDGDEDDDEEEDGRTSSDDGDDVGFGEGDTSSAETDGDSSADEGESGAVDDSPQESGGAATDFTVDPDSSVPETYGDNGAYPDDDTAGTDSHADPREEYSTEV
jgi:hypothetical protein